MIMSWCRYLPSLFARSLAHTYRSLSRSELSFSRLPMTSKDELRAQAREGQDSAEAAAPAVVVQVDPTPPTKPQAPPEVQLRSGCWLFDLVLKDLERVEAATVSLIVLNVLSSIGIVFLNKWLFVFLNFPYSTCGASCVCAKCHR